MTALYYVIGSFEKNGLREYQGLHVGGKTEAREFYKRFKKHFPNKKAKLHIMWELKSEGKEFLDNYVKADELCKKICRGELSIKDMPNKLNESQTEPY